MSRRAQGDAPESVNLADCDVEPIHIPASIQPRGFLLVFGGPEFKVLQASQNAVEFLGRPLDWILSRTLRQVLGARAAELILPSLKSISEDSNPRHLGVIPIGVEGHEESFNASAYALRDVRIVELEPLRDLSPVSFEKVYPLIDAFVASVQATRSVEELNRLAAHEIRRMTGFDRVLVYRFDADWSGTVIAEERNEVFPSLLDHRFPASDIPSQARDLYRKNRIRLIADANYKPVPIIPALRPDNGAPLDLTYSALRSVSPVHLEYMRNMGTLASMSITLLREGELWGLISCHHAKPWEVPFQIRAACELIGQVLSLQLEASDHHAEFERRIQLKSIQVKLLERMAAEDDYRDGLVRDPELLLGFASASGAAVVAADRCTLIAETPTEAEVRRLVEWLDGEVKKEVYSTSSLASVLPEAERYAGSASGLLAISISKLHPSYVLWFRPEVTQTINWAGDPRKPLSNQDDNVRISPRKSFEKWVETVRHTAIRFRQSEVEAAVELRNAVIGVVLRKAEEMAELTGELERSNKELEAFSYSVSHDLRAPFRHIVGFSELLRESAEGRLEPDERGYLEIIVGSAQQPGLLVDSLLAFSRMGRQQLNYHRVNMNELVDEVVQSLTLGTKNDREILWRVSSLPVVLGDVMMLRQVVQNLLSNAVKFSGPQPEAVIEVGSTSDEREDVFFVKDHGVGFDMKYVDKLFGVFQRLHRMEDFEGTGIGLANVRRIVMRHGGRTWAQSAPGEGATFFFTLPKGAAPLPEK